SRCVIAHLGEAGSRISLQHRPFPSLWMLKWNIYNCNLHVRVFQIKGARQRGGSAVLLHEYHLLGVLFKGALDGFEKEQGCRFIPIARNTAQHPKKRHSRGWLCYTIFEGGAQMTILHCQDFPCTGC